MKEKRTEDEFDKLFKRTPLDVRERELRTKISYEKDVSIKEKLLLQSKKLANGDPIDLHFAYMGLMDVYYRQRNTKENALNLCIDYCKKDIEIFPIFKKADNDQLINQLKFFQKSYEYDSERYLEYEQSIKNVPNRGHHTPAYKRLAIIYEKQGEFQKAIDICNQAIGLGYSDDTKNGFEGRKDRLYKKLRGVLR